MATAKKVPMRGRELALVTAASMLAGGYGIMLLSLTLMYGNDRGFASVAAGFLSSVFAFASLGARPFSGAACDRFSNKSVFILSAAGMAITPLVFLIDAPYPVLVAARILQGICMGGATTAAGAIATVIIPRERFTEGIGYFGIGMAASSAVAPGVGLWLLENFGYFGVFAASACMGAAAAALISPIRCGPASRPQEEGGFLSRLYEKTALYATVCTLILSVAQVTIMQFLSYHVTARGASGTGSFYAVSAVAVIAVRLLGGKLRQILPDKGILLVGTVLLFSAYGGLYFLFPSAAILMALSIAYGAGHSATGMVLNAIAVAKAPPDRVGAANATYLMASDLGYALGPILWNVYCDRMGYPGIYLLSALAVAALFFVFVLKKDTPTETAS